MLHACKAYTTEVLGSFGYSSIGFIYIERKLNKLNHQCNILKLPQANQILQVHEKYFSQRKKALHQKIWDHLRLSISHLDIIRTKWEKFEMKKIPFANEELASRFSLSFRYSMGGFSGSLFFSGLVSRPLFALPKKSIGSSLTKRLSKQKKN